MFMFFDVFSVWSWTYIPISCKKLLLLYEPKQKRTEEEELKINTKNYNERIKWWGLKKGDHPICLNSKGKKIISILLLLLLLIV